MQWPCSFFQVNPGTCVSIVSWFVRNACGGKKPTLSPQIVTELSVSGSGFDLSSAYFIMAGGFAGGLDEVIDPFLVLLQDVQKLQADDLSLFVLGVGHPDHLG